MRTFGRATLAGSYWILEVEPHIAMKAKAVFPKIDKREHGRLHLTATDANSRDLEWFLQRYPLEVCGMLLDGQQELERRARAWDARAETSARILEGTYELPDVEMALPPREYQRKGAALALNTGGLLLADELGLGKTVTALTLLAQGRQLPALVVCQAHLTQQWRREVERFLPELQVHIAKTGRPYDVTVEGRFPDVLILTYHKLSGWADELAGHCPTVIFDECQELRRTGSQKYSAARYVTERAETRLGLSATPIYNYGNEFWAVMNVLAPGSIGTREEFLREWCHAAYREGKETLADSRAFGTYLREAGLMLRRTRKEVRRELPDLVRVVHEVETDDLHGRLALQRVEESALELARIIVEQQGKGIDQMRAAGEFDMRLRQATGLAKARPVAHFTQMLIDAGDSVVLFGWHRAVYEVWKGVFAAAGIEPAWYTGSESASKKVRELDRFVRGDTPLLIMSLRAGSGVDGLQRIATRVVIGELDWSPGVLEQCIGRVHRDGQAEPVMAYYLLATEGADPVMADVLGVKKAQLDGVKEPFGELVVPKQVDPDHVKALARDYLARRGGGEA